MIIVPTLGKITKALPATYSEIRETVRNSLGMHRAFPKVTIVFCLVSILTIISCHTADTSKSESDSRISVPNDFRLVIGEGGGFTGEWIGNTVDSSGSVLSWRGSQAEKNPRQTSKLKATQLQNLWQSIDEGRFFDRDSSGTGNMTQIMIVTANGKVHRVTWAKSNGSVSDLTPVQRLYNSCIAIISRNR